MTTDFGSLKKPTRGSFLIERKGRSKDRVAAEDAQKALVRKRDGRCRYPHCPVCRAHKKLRLEVAHVLQAKGMSGDRTLERSAADRMMLLDVFTHGRQEQHLIEIVPLTDRGTAGACEFWNTDEQGQKYLVARELAPFVYERD